jgi:Family of unknown function (DUF6011)
MINATNKIDANEAASYAGFESMADDDIGPMDVGAACDRQMKQNARFDNNQKMFTEPCSKCGGKGYIGAYMFRENGKCYQCGGIGTMQFKQPKEVRQRNNELAKIRKANKQEADFKEFEQSWPDVAAWWKDSDFPFAVSLREACFKYGNLTEGQMNAALKCVNKIKALKEAAAVRVAAAPTVEINFVNEALSRARESGIKRPKIRLLGNNAEFEFSRAPDHGVNAGAVYVNQADLYLGKITQGKFVRGRDCTDDMERDILVAIANPEDSAVAYGRRFGTCSCCGRELSNQESVDLGIGPICRQKFFGV